MRASHRQVCCKFLGVVHHAINTGSRCFACVCHSLIQNDQVEDIYVYGHGQSMYLLDDYGKDGHHSWTYLCAATIGHL